MRNFSSQVPVAMCFSYFVGCKIGSNDWHYARSLLMSAFGGHDVSSLTPSEEGVLNDFNDWVTQLNEQSDRSPNGAFFYINMNTGISLCFVGWVGYEEYVLSHIPS